MCGKYDNLVEKIVLNRIFFLDFIEMKKYTHIYREELQVVLEP